MLHNQAIAGHMENIQKSLDSLQMEGPEDIRTNVAGSLGTQDDL